MLFPTLDFAIFFLFVYLATWMLGRHNSWRKLLLLASSYFFYASWDWRFAFLLAGSSLFNYYVGRQIFICDGTVCRKLYLIVGIAGNLSVLGFFKYYGFFMESMASVAQALSIERDLPFLEIILPVGISFFTFQGMSYLIDVFHRKINGDSSLLDLFLYISFFPQLVAGPIVRATTFLPQLRAAPDPGRVCVAFGMLLILWGLFKKAIIANYLAVEIVDPVFFDPSAYGSIDLLAAVYAYAVQIYCDFSAYSDMAIGVAALLGYRFPTNFDQPYRAQSIAEFWRRWHISLSTWFRDYLYIPLGGSKSGKLRTHRNLIVTMLLGGVWHGAAWNFILWGALHGLMLSAERMLRGSSRVIVSPEIKSLKSVLSVLLVFHLVCVGWVFFRAESFSNALTIFEGLVLVDMKPLLLTPFVATLIVLGLAIHYVPRTVLSRLEASLARTPAIIQGLFTGGIIILVSALSMEEVAPFIYFQF